LSYTLLYARRYRELNLTDNPHLFVEPPKNQSTESETRIEIPDLKIISMARMFNLRFVILITTLSINFMPFLVTMMIVLSVLCLSI
jgi:hypothetical protein